jgi:hypothetical protein
MTMTSPTARAQVVIYLYSTLRLSSHLPSKRGNVNELPSIADNDAIHIAFFKGGLLLDGGVCRRTSTPDVVVVRLL